MQLAVVLNWREQGEQGDIAGHAERHVAAWRAFSFPPHRGKKFPSGQVFGFGSAGGSGANRITTRSSLEFEQLVVPCLGFPPLR